VNDPERIKAFAHDVSLGSYSGRHRGGYLYAIPVEIRCYRNNEHMISFKVFSDFIMTEDLRHFRYPKNKGLPNLEIIEPPEMRPFKLRFQCGLNMQTLYTVGPLYQREVSSYPEPTEWCDAIVRVWRNMYSIENGIRARLYSEEEISRFFKCPSARESIYSVDPNDEPNSPKKPEPLLECHYAMNPTCKPNSLPDTVLLFETKVGWNQHGGPEIFTFNNHDPRGGCVLLNDGTVKFIRTELELLQLRWE